MNILYKKQFPGNFILFNNEEDVLSFFSKLDVCPEELENYGVFVDFDEHTEEYIEIIERC